jgi:hypothetical protein
MDPAAPVLIFEPTSTMRTRYALLLPALLLIASSCSSKSSDRVDVWGTVTFKSKPVPAGLIVMNPDFSKGNDGPQGMAEIREGRFDTRPLDKGAPSGPVVFMIDGFDGVAQGESSSGRPLFVSYKMQLDLSKQASEQHIVVPESAGATAKAAYGPVP